MSFDPVEYEDRWLLGYRDLSVTEICITQRLSLVLDTAATIVLAAPVWLSEGSIRNSDSPRTELVAARQDVAGILRLYGGRILSSVAFKSGSLRLVFDSGLHLNCQSDASVDAWLAIGPGQWRVTSLAGGGLRVANGEKTFT
jgi:hypothetical protein